MEKNYKEFYLTQNRKKIELKPSIPVKVTKDCYLDNCEGYKFSHGFFEDYLAKPLEFYVLENAFLIDGVMVLHENEIIKETAYQCSYRTSMLQNPILNEDNIIKIKEYEPEEYIEKTGFLFNTLLENFGHWHVQSLFNSAFFNLAEKETGEKISDMILINTNGFENEHFRYQSLEKFGISKLFFINPRQELRHKTIKFKKLLIPTTHALYTHNRFHPYISQYLRSKMLSGLKKDINSPKRIFINRKDAPFERRSIQNNEELEQKLSKAGFVSVSNANLSYEEQLSLFYNAEVVISPHGGSLTNLLAANPDLKIFEIFHSSIFNGWYRNLADAAGLRYKAYCTDVSRTQDRDKYRCFNVNCDLILEEIIKYIY